MSERIQSWAAIIGVAIGISGLISTVGGFVYYYGVHDAHTGLAENQIASLETKVEKDGTALAQITERLISNSSAIAEAQRQGQISVDKINAVLDSIATINRRVASLENAVAALSTKATAKPIQEKCVELATEADTNSNGYFSGGDISKKAIETMQQLGCASRGVEP